jgi:hypothetical protein
LKRDAPEPKLNIVVSLKAAKAFDDRQDSIGSRLPRLYRGVANNHDAGVEAMLMKNGFVCFAFVLGLSFPFVANGDETVKTQTNVPVEITLKSPVDRTDPFHQVEVDGIFKSPSGKEFRVPAFWAGGRVWKLRYASAEQGIHTFRTQANVADAGLNAVDGRIEVVPYLGENPLFRHGPIRVAADTRHMMHADGTPFFWLGDTWWMGLCSRLKFPEDFATLTADRKSKGFNVVQIVAGLYPDMPPFDPRGANEAGFPWTAKYGQIRPEYFDAADRRLQYLVDQGITPCIVGMWGYFMPEMGVAKASQHWRYLIARYSSWPVVWCVAGEANLPYYLAKNFPSDDRDQVHGWTDVMRYVRKTDPFRRPTTIHPTAIRRYTSRNATDDESLLDFDMLQTPHGQREAAVITLQAMRDSMAAKPKMPVINGEAAYERLSDSLPTEWTRAMFWICMAEGAGGHTYGANGIWQVNRKGQPHGKSPHGGTYGVISWDEAMVLPGSGQLGAAKKFLSQFQWEKFETHPEWVEWDNVKESEPPAMGGWIWYPEGDSSRDAPVAPRFFSREFDIPASKQVKRAWLRIGADDRYEVWVNEKQKGAGGSWLDPLLVDVSSSLHAGKNFLSIKGENAAAPVKLNPAGLTAALEIEYLDGSKDRIETNGQWKSSQIETPGWKAGKTDSNWKPAHEIGVIGTAPWGHPQSRKLFPALGFGVTDGVRVFWMLEPKPVVFRGLKPGHTYSIQEFDPVLGQVQATGRLKADASGAIHQAAPAHSHDWVIAIIP